MNKNSGSMLDKWGGWYANVTEENLGAFLYGDTITYKLAAEFLNDLDLVEDWGCGTGGFRRFFTGDYYIGVDGSQNTFVDRVEDLRTYTTVADGILLRHILEHNYDWGKVLSNAVNSFQKKLCLILFSPFSKKTHEIAHNLKYGVDVPDISFCRKDIEKHFKGLKWKLTKNLKTDTGYGVEHIYYVTKK